MVFGSVAKGFKAGGFNARASSVGGIGPYKDEKVTSIEGGIKSDWLDERLRANVTLFHNDYKQLQVEVIVPSSVGPGQETLVKNAGDAYTEGLEVEFTAAPVEGLQLNANVGYLKAKYTSFFADVFGTGTPTDNTFLELRRAPKWTIDTGFIYDRPVGEYGKLIFAGDVNHTTHYQTDVTNDTFALRPTATLLNANIAYEPASGAYRVAIFGKNLADRRFINNGINAGRLFAFNEPNRPRTFGVEVEVKF
jgi:iron complex outermembrane receptor protein